METVDNIQFVELWNQYEPRLRQMCNIKLQSVPDEIDDVISEVFLALCKKVNESGLPKNPKTWLYGTLNNKILKEYEKIYKEKAISMADIEYILPSSIDFIEEIEDKSFLDNLIKICEKELTESEKTLLLYVYKERLTMKEIAEILHSSEFAVKQKHYRLCKHLRKIAERIM